MKSRSWFAVSIGALALLGVVAFGAQKHAALPYYGDVTLTPQFLTDAASIGRAHTVGTFSFVDQQGETVTNATTAGRVYVASFFYANCRTLCPALRTQLARVHETFAGDSGVLILSHTVQPERDDVGKLQHYASLNGIDHKQWRLLSGDRSMLQKLARDAYFVELSDTTGNTIGQLKHTETLVLVDKSGHIRGVYNGSLAFEVSQLIEDVKTLRRED